MNVLPVVKKDFQDAARSKLLWALLVLFVLGIGGITIGLPEVVERLGQLDLDLSVLGLIALMTGRITFGFGPIPVLVPVIGLLLGYNAIVGEQESGSIKLLLSLPHSREDVIFGKLLGRTGVAGVSLLAGFFVAMVIGLLLYNAFSLVDFTVFFLVTLLFITVHISIGIGISAGAPSHTIAVIAVLVFVGLFQALWGAIMNVIAIVDAGFDLGEAFLTQDPTWLTFLRILSPSNAYERALAAVIPRLDVGAQAADPFYVQPWFGFVILLFWLVVPLGIGYYVFEAADL